MTLVSINAKKKNLNFDVILDLFLWCFPFAIIGARAYYVLFELENYHSFWDMINIRQGGLAIHGGIICSIYVHTPLNKLRKFTNKLTSYLSTMCLLVKEIS